MSDLPRHRGGANLERDRGRAGAASIAIAGALVDLGAVTLTFVAAGAIVIVAAVAGIAWGVPTQMVWPEEQTP